MYEDFIAAIHAKNHVQVEFHSKEDMGVLSRLCAPMDFGPSRRAKDGLDRFHLWNFGSDEKPHVLSLTPDAIAQMTVLNTYFDPTDFVTWTPNWFVARDWGALS